MVVWQLLFVQCWAPAIPLTLDESAGTIFRNGERGYPFFRIPSLLRVSSTLLLAFAEARSQRQDHGNVAIVVKSSTDAGASWSELREVHAEQRTTIGNPCPLYDSPDIVLFFCRENERIFETRSTDSGTSWSMPRELQGWSRPPSWQWLAAGPPAALVTSSGRWVLPCDGLTGSKQIYKAKSIFSFVLFSDDRGESWRQGSLIEGGNECQAVELADGSLLLNMRSTEMVRLQARSLDGGESWSVARPATPPVHDGNCQGSTIALDQSATRARRLNGVPLLATSTDAGRKVLTARSSIDGGESWQTHSIVERGPAAYSALVDLGRGVVGCLYETKRPKDAPTGRVAGDGASSRKAHSGRKEDDDVLRFVRLNVSHLVGLHGETPAHDEL